MDAFATAQEPDEGYSEHPLTPSGPTGNEDDTILGALRSAAGPSVWLSAHMSKLSIEEKTRLALLFLNDLPTTVISDIVMNQLNPRLYINFVERLPPEICLKILGYLDSVSLIHVARCCMGWYELAVDYKLWERLYYMEGWKSIPSEIVAAQERMNETLVISQLNSHKIRYAEDGHIHKKRVVSEPAPQDEDDCEMIDVDVDAASRPDTSLPSFSLFGGPQQGGSGSSIQSNMSVAQHMGNLVMKSPSPLPDLKGKSRLVKGKSVADSSMTTSSLEEATNGCSRLSKSSLWLFDGRHRTYRINWKYLYTMRRRLERNWDRGRYTNFQLPHPDHLDEGHHECIYSLQYNAEYLVSGSRDRTLRVWNLRTRRLVRPPLAGHAGSVLCLQFDSDPEEDLIVSGSSDSDVILWKFSTGEILQRLRRAHRESVLNVKFDKRILVTCSKDKTIKIFNRKALRPGDVGYGEYHGVGPVPINLRNYGYDDSPMDQLAIKPPYTMIGCLDGHNAAVNAVQICGDEIVSASGDRLIKVWDWPSQICRKTVVGHTKGIACVQYDGRRIVSGSSDNEVKVFDVETRLEVASLRAHTNLVRTVQAGFGDLPYSAEEDRLQAKAVDQAYFKALNAGSLQDLQTLRRRPHNAGSRRPEDITAYGAKLPPGGGGGRYGRIISGSYDQSIIIWRRDREGIWRSAHTLRQEEGASAAFRQASGTSASAVPRRPPSPHPAAAELADASPTPGQSQAPPPQPASAPPALQQPPPTFTHVEEPIYATVTPQTTASYTRMLDAAVVQGPTALHHALNAYPTMLTYSSHIQAAIDREPNALTRSNLRSVVNTALVRAQLAQNRIRDSVQQGSAEASSSLAAPARSSQAAGSRASYIHSSYRQSQTHVAGPSAVGPAEGGNTTGAGGGPPNILSNTLPPIQHLEQHPHLPPHSQSLPPLQLPPQHHNSHQTQDHEPVQSAATVTATATATPAPAPAPAHGNQQQQHPHIAQADTSAARIFKLQFDARRIICCSQISTIVGWDFCNGDPELEEAARFFGTVE